MTAASTMQADIVRELALWEQTKHAATFPYDLIISRYRACGKHFVPVVILEALAATRARLGPAAEGDRDRALLDRFLAVALDKWDGRYDYLSYLGIDLLDLVPDADGPTARRQRDEWVGLLLADAWDFEDRARDGSLDWLPRVPPDTRLAEKRIRLIAAALSPVLGEHPASSSVGYVRATVRRLMEAAPPERKRALSLSMQPVYVVHDEYVFIRVLQSFEVTFAAMAAELRDAILAVRCGRSDEAAACVTRCSRSLDAARRLFTLLATMRPESFRIFRAYTVGASAIQSGNYKIFEALCSLPAQARLESPAYAAVPRVRRRLDTEWSDLTSEVEASMARGVVDSDGLAALVVAARELESVHQQWKQTHWKMAVRMIGEERGTGYTVGVPYLKDALGNRLFPRLSQQDGGARA